MSKYPEFMKTRAAVAQSSNIDLSFTTITTQDFGYLKPIVLREMVPGDKFDVNINTMIRTAPLYEPEYSDVHLSMRGFFVPSRILFTGWTSFISGHTYIDDQGQEVECTLPYIKNSDIVRLFFRSDYSNKFVEEVTESQAHDFAWDNHYYRLTPMGRKSVDMLDQCGIRINWTEADETEFNALRLFAIHRIFFDWILPSEYTNLYYGQKWFHSVKAWDMHTDDLDLYLLCTPVFAFLNRDYFTSAWKNPMSPSAEGHLSTNVRVNGTANFVTESPNGGTEVVQRSNLTDLTVRTLDRLQDFLTRNQIAGSRYVEQILARFGIHTPDAILDRSDICGFAETPIRISDVMSTADTKGTGSTGTQLGDYAGKMIGTGNGQFNYTAKEHGYFVVLASIKPTTGYVQGRDREAMHTDMLDFFTPEFDGLGTQPIRNDEIFADFLSNEEYTAGQAHGGRPDGIFGWTPQYSEYKISKDKLNGDFMIPSASVGMDSWHLFRQFKAPSADNPLALNESFMTASLDGQGNTFDRIFNYTGNLADHFVIRYSIAFHAIRPMLSLTESMPVNGGKELTIPKNGIML